MSWPRTIRGRIAVSIAVAVLGSAVVFAAASAGAFYLETRAEAARRHRTPERQAAEDRENLRMLVRMGGGMALVLPLAVAGSAVLGLWLAARALAPMREAAARARHARSGSVELTLPIRGTGDEWDDLAGVMNDLLREQRQSIAREKAFSASAAHELRTPLTAMLGEVQVTLRRERTATEYRAALEATEAEVKRLSSLVEALLSLARADSGQLQAASVPFDFGEVARTAVDRVRRRQQGTHAAIEVEAAIVPVIGDPLLTGRVLDNLLENALRHAGTRVAVRVARKDGYGMAVVADDGPGVPPDVRARLFDRFNKLAGSSDGFGLGLAIAHAYVVAQHGVLRLDGDAPLTSFILGLPLERGIRGHHTQLTVPRTVPGRGENQ
ncbi:MAG: sensor histidine kinase [Myxococcales bacterium]